MASHKLRCPRCGRHVKVIMDTKRDVWVFSRHVNMNTQTWCTYSGKPA